MDRRTARQKATTPAAVAQTLCDLLQNFPAAATTGVQWQTLEKKYEERCGAPLDIAVLGYSTALAAATALLWDVMRVVDREDVDNPVVAIESSISLTARPGYLACWPSLYGACCDVVQAHGAVDGDSRSLLLSQLKPYLQKSWHSGFTECGLNYFTEQGKFVSLKKMKHLVTALLRWRAEHQDGSQSSSSRLKDVHKVLTPTLALEQSKTHNDWLLRYYMPLEGRTVGNCCQKLALGEANEVSPASETAEVASPSCGGMQNKMLWSDIDTCELDDRWSDLESLASSPSSLARSSRSASSSSPESLRELAALRAENARLRSEKDALERRGSLQDEACSGMFHIPAFFSMHGMEPELFDDPFEPPPQKRDCNPWSLASSTASPGPSDFAWSTIGTPGPSSTSGAATPALNFTPAPMAPAFALQACAFVPVATIPSGIVKQARSLFERADRAIPSFFVQQS
eukprot:TRINITY_DN28667_c0_g1_i1.p1 TRINITY_DN28667_c0_g1~~TRINITY_DN28667_c0_g1_i1.p1  ORF type:complete len:458 (-),score=73.64 TRINITY_DN28667_c0_g1_i1:520-1893(-)